jgi:UDP-glucuronate 4-epimerase
VFNIGNNNPINLIDFIETIGSALGKKVKKNMLPMQAGDVPETYADIDDLYNEINFKPQTCIENGILKFVNWYKFYKTTNSVKIK